MVRPLRKWEVYPNSWKWKGTETESFHLQVAELKQTSDCYYLWHFLSSRFHFMLRSASHMYCTFCSWNLACGGLYVGAKCMQRSKTVCMSRCRHPVKSERAASSCGALQRKNTVGILHASCSSSLRTYSQKTQLFSSHNTTNYLPPEGRGPGTFTRLTDAKPRVKSDTTACPILLGMHRCKVASVPGGSVLM